MPTDPAAASVLQALARTLGRWGDDARGLWRIHGDTLDAGRIESVLRLLEEALGQSDLLPAFKALRKRRRR